MNRVKATMKEDEAKRAEALFASCRPDRGSARACFKRYIFYEPVSRSRRRYICPECGVFEMGRPATDLYSDDIFAYKHKDTTTCPNCGAPGILIAKGRIRSGKSLFEKHHFMFLYEREGMLLIQTGDVSMDYYEDYCPTPDFWPNKRYAFTKDKRMAWNIVWEKGYAVWRRMKSVNEPWTESGYYQDDWYHLSGAEEAERSELRYSALKPFLDSFYTGRGVEITDNSTDIIAYLCAWQRRPQIEMLTKLGHIDEVRMVLGGDDLVGCDWKAKTPQGFFRLSKAEYRIFREMKANEKLLRRYRACGQGIGLEKYLHINKVFDGNGDLFLAIFGKDKRRDRMVRWFEGQRRATWRLWKDTLDMEAKLGNDITHDDVLMPKDLRSRHDRCAEMLEDIKLKNRKDYGEKRLPELEKKYAFAAGGLMIRAPKDGMEIKAEGKALKHCVAGYAERHLDGIKTILFLRWEDDPDTPYITIEVDDAWLVQIHGYRNEGTGKQMAPMEIHGDFINAWLAWVKAGSKRTKNGKARVKEMTA